MPNYVDVTHFTFVCTKCSGLHRELQYKVKGIGMSNFTEEELVSIEAMGNTKFNESYLARYDQSPPNANDLPRFKDYLKQKYVDKKWFVDKDRMVVRSSSEVPSNIPPPPHVNQVGKVGDDGVANLLFQFPSMSNMIS